MPLVVKLTSRFDDAVALSWKSPSPQVLFANELKAMVCDCLGSIVNVAAVVVAVMVALAVLVNTARY